MINKHQNVVDNVLAFLIYMISFYLFRLWLWPLIELKVIAYPNLLVLFSAVMFLLSFLRLPLIVSSIFKITAGLFVLDRLYLLPSPFTAPWLGAIVEELIVNQQALFAAEWHRVSPFGEMLLMLVLINIIAYLLYYWLVKMHRVFLFNVLTLIYLTVMDTFTPYQLYPRLLLMMFLMITLMMFNSLRKKMINDRLVVTGSHLLARLILPLLVMFGLFMTVYNQLPIREPTWPDPVPFITGGFQQGETERRIGYGEDDSVLGGSLADNDALVFRAIAEEPNYWRVDAKEVYTGRGWERQSDPQFVPYTALTLSTQTAELIYSDQTNFNKVAYPYHLRAIDAGQAAYRHDPEIGLVEPVGAFKIDRITLAYEPPVYEEATLDQLTLPYETPVDPVYLALPNTLPERVHQLAAEIKGNETNPYRIAQRMERYFKQTGFLYQTEDVEVPGENKDYVDQFLFESRAGYCDNFSTSMVVMLRSVGIPARWVKGFNTGTENADNYYEVRQNNAHSWVEVYFEDIGWMPFEPTVGFTSPRQMLTNVDMPVEEEDAFENDESSVEDQLEEADLINNENEETSAKEAESVSEDAMRIDMRVVYISLCVLMTMFVVSLLLFWRRVLYYMMRKSYLPFVSEQGAVKAVSRLFFLLRLMNKKRSPEETLKQYGERLDQDYDTNGFSQLILSYEKIVYGNRWDENTKEAIEKFYLFALQSILS
ncbi:hypothetical protein GCM10012290_23120 [Halolactibacillus alkaliphilus]|uniref:Transglutaminase-like domain-containing protein n=1 Tax=Halolactibacillus alkaliphilus TaxID=442899 RepID=A0A511X437_9BACI|nr:transglutaminase domain-containing protein [Halolactibacillus alkaliphilus]GEN57701.1 hypothetical protein HAL01_21650 [Halolactibacillus alkaliphilus]GGN74854.1 hypothetical protein GCM10012290_23120 [Halolactibacillus alkaliphilus]SFP03605.1 Transglutaminase-like superfamily protein [Halolactibacillus alkaliphilus]